MAIGTYIEYFSRICQGFNRADRQIIDGLVFLGLQLSFLINSMIIDENSQYFQVIPVYFILIGFNYE